MDEIKIEPEIIKYGKDSYLISDEKISTGDRIYSIHTKEIDHCIHMFSDGDICMEFGELSSSRGMRAILNSKHFKKAIKIKK